MLSRPGSISKSGGSCTGWRPSGLPLLRALNLSA
jgi:hypothetical protein